MKTINIQKVIMASPKDIEVIKSIESGLKHWDPNNRKLYIFLKPTDYIAYSGLSNSFSLFACQAILHPNCIVVRELRYFIKAINLLYYKTNIATAIDSLIYADFVAESILSLQKILGSYQNSISISVE